MTINQNANTQVQVDQAHRAGVAVAAQKDLARVQSENTLRNELKDREHAYAPSVISGAMREEVEQLSIQLERLKKTVAERDVELAEREARMLEWMHSNEVFKRLAIKLAKQDAIPEDAFKDMVAQESLIVAQEDPRFANMALLRKAKARMAQPASVAPESGAA